MNNREIDRLVATKIMGWNITETSDGAEWIQAEDYKPRFSNNLDDWSPTECIEHAWLVVEKLEERQIVSLWWIMQRIRNKGINSAKQIPYHICLAALKAVDVEVQS